MTSGSPKPLANPGHDALASSLLKESLGTPGGAIDCPRVCFGSAHPAANFSNASAAEGRTCLAHSAVCYQQLTEPLVTNGSTAGERTSPRFAELRREREPAD